MQDKGFIIYGLGANGPIPIGASASQSLDVTLTDANNNQPGAVQLHDGVSQDDIGLETVAALYGFDGTSVFNRIREVGTDSDGVAGLAAGAMASASFLYGFNTLTWDQLICFGNNVDGVLPILNSGALTTCTFPMGWNGTTWDRIASGANNADAVAALTLGVQAEASYAYAWNGAKWDRVRNNSAANLSATTQPFGMMVAQPGEWSITHSPTANTKATATKAAGAAGVRHVVRSISAFLAINSGGVIVAPSVVNVRDGASGAGTVLWTGLLGDGSSGAGGQVTLTGLNIIGSAATAMTIEFTAAAGANILESVTLSGYDTI
jgi:hypothetical protein